MPKKTSSMQPLYGAEIEKPVAGSTDGSVHYTSQQFFKQLTVAAQHRQTFDHTHDVTSQKMTIGVISTDLGEQGIDNGFNLLETALPPQTSLTDLQAKMAEDLKTTQDSLAKENATTINLSIHPLASRTPEAYQKFVAPKELYKYLWFRGWDHSAGIDARAQNSPTTQIPVDQAADALSVMIAATAATIGLFANSPFENGQLSGFKETRLTMWDRMMGQSKVAGDKTVSHFPPQRFKTMAEYFNWMFGTGTGIHFVLADSNGSDYKSMADQLLVIEGNPPVLEYLAKPSWKAHTLTNLLSDDFTHPIMVVPKISDMELMQFAQFEPGGRIRYALKTGNFPIEDFVNACRQPDQFHVEEIFEKWAKYTYIEGRAPGNNLPDQELWTAGNDIAASVEIGPAALQAGLLQNLEAAKKYLFSFEWEQLHRLRTAAIKDGLQGRAGELTVSDFAQKVVDIAAAGLSTPEQSLLAYVHWVLKTQQNGADRALTFIDQQSSNHSLEQSLRTLIKSRKVVLPL